MSEPTKLMAPTGAAIVGTLEVIPGMARVIGVERDAMGAVTFAWSGETEVAWEDQQTVADDGERVFVDECWDYWTESQLVPEGTEPDPKTRPIKACSTFTGIFARGWRAGVHAAISTIMQFDVTEHSVERVVDELEALLATEATR